MRQAQSTRFLANFQIPSVKKILLHRVYGRVIPHFDASGICVTSAFVKNLFALGTSCRERLHDFDFRLKSIIAIWVDWFFFNHQKCIIWWNGIFYFKRFTAGENWRYTCLNNLYMDSDNFNLTFNLNRSLKWNNTTCVFSFTKHNKVLAIERFNIFIINPN